MVFHFYKCSTLQEDLSHRTHLTVLRVKVSSLGIVSTLNIYVMILINIDSSVSVEVDYIFD
jgi:hypothetical protein